MVDQIRDTAQLEQVTAKFYFEFFDEHKDLFKNDPGEYQSQLRRFVEERIHEIKYGVRQL